MQISHKRNAGFSMLEVIVSVGILAIIVGPILGMFLYATQINAQARKMELATYTAQMRMEELVGMDKSQLLGECGLTEEEFDLMPDDEVNVIDEDYNGYCVTVDILFGYNGSDSLAFVTVSVSEAKDEPVLSAFENVLRVK